MTRPAALIASVIAAPIAAMSLLASPPASAQVRGDIAYGTLSMGCLPNDASHPSNNPGLIIILVTNFRQVVPQGTAVTVTYLEPTGGFSLFGKTYGVTWVQKTTVYRTRHTMHSSDPEDIGVRGYCLSATYTSNQPVLAR